MIRARRRRRGAGLGGATSKPLITELPSRPPAAAAAAASSPGAAPALTRDLQSLQQLVASSLRPPEPEDLGLELGLEEGDGAVAADRGGPAAEEAGGPAARRELGVVVDATWVVGSEARVSAMLARVLPPLGAHATASVRAALSSGEEVGIHQCLRCC